MQYYAKVAGQFTLYDDSLGDPPAPMPVATMPQVALAYVKTETGATLLTHGNESDMTAWAAAAGAQVKVLNGNVDPNAINAVLLDPSKVSTLL